MTTNDVAEPEDAMAAYQRKAALTREVVTEARLANFAFITADREPTLADLADQLKALTVQFDALCRHQLGDFSEIP